MKLLSRVRLLATPWTAAYQAPPSMGFSLLYWLSQSLDCVDHNKLWKIIQEMGIPDHLTSLLRNLYTGQEATVTTGHGTRDWFQIRKGVCQGCILSPCLFNLYAEWKWMCKSLSRLWLFATPQMAAHQAPPSLGFSRQEHGSGLPFPSPMHESEKWKWSHLVVSDS